MTGVMPAGFDPAVEPRGGLTADQVADLALRCGRAEAEVERLQVELDIAEALARDDVAAAQEAARQVEVLEAALVRACRHTQPWILREMGIR